MKDPGKREIMPKNTPVPLDKCGMAQAASVLMEKWTMLIIREAFYGIARFEDFQEDLEIPRSVLSKRLTTLVELEILERIAYQPDGSRKRYGYLLTQKGQDLGLAFLALMQWGDKHLNGGESAIRVTDSETKQYLEVALVPRDGPKVPLKNVRFDILKPSSQTMV